MSDLPMFSRPGRSSKFGRRSLRARRSLISSALNLGVPSAFFCWRSLFLSSCVAGKTWSTWNWFRVSTCGNSAASTAKVRALPYSRLKMSSTRASVTASGLPRRDIARSIAATGNAVFPWALMTSRRSRSRVSRPEPQTPRTIRDRSTHDRRASRSSRVFGDSR
ncbi:hypothetical protein ACFFX0_32810 [Citricoccus parietis]|uniref:Uncharacterized protein n=1 Tax=Citricoccus parietis TaxID=592307 RepID=A0ABV5G9T2_9MICC